ncbi:Fic family protein [Qipengyuania sp. DSG2-2]|uniref:Fic family protein n=1 Tax=Qipengyuania sp. DGS2-2 TaxID=3349631 RepID=UPI0036D404DC
MIEDNWDLITGNSAHEIEVLNYSNQVNVIEALLHLMIHQQGNNAPIMKPPPRGALNEFHRTATLFLLMRPGSFRREEVVVSTADGKVIHEPPPHSEVQGHVEGFLSTLDREWDKLSAQEIAGYCLWIINWIHPFKNGNGRTARAFSYAVLSLKLGFILPGERTVIDLIMDNRDDYQNALKIADKSHDLSGQADLAPMTDFIDRLLAEQLSSL